MYRKLLKPFFDFLFALFLLVIFSPFMIVLFFLLAISNQGNPIFIQQRPGFKAKPFYLIKFKTMNNKKDKNGNLLPDEKRLNRFGKMIRKTSLDELPQLINVLKGDLSLIGPRPLLMEYLPLYSAQQMKRHDVKPGISGWSQVNGRNLLSWEKRFELDLYYVDHLSLNLDLLIAFKTINQVFRAKGVSSSTSATMEKFEGRNHVK